MGVGRWVCQADDGEVERERERERERESRAFFFSVVLFCSVVWPMQQVCVCCEGGRSSVRQPPQATKARAREVRVESLLSREATMSAARKDEFQPTADVSGDCHALHCTHA